MQIFSVIFLSFILFLQGNADDGFESTLGHLRPSTSNDVQRNAVLDLIKRVLPNRFNDFGIRIDPSIAPIGKTVFKLESNEGGTINITGSSGVGASWGFYHYLKFYCKAHISWETEQLNIPEKLPEVNVTIVSNDRFRYYMNLCSFSYSTPWWHWKDWEKHIDWIAMNGFNLVMAPIGQEAIWLRVYQRFNMTDYDINEHFTGPGFLAWNRLGNVRNWGGPLSRNWHERSIVLQKAILKRLREFGIIPILQGFNGFVPRAFKKLHPETSMTSVRWDAFDIDNCCLMHLESSTLLFKEIGRMYLSELISEFGTDHVYNVDSFHEMTPISNNTNYLQILSSSIFRSLIDVDPDAVWVMQSWLFDYSSWFWKPEVVKIFLTAVPMGRMIILDTQAELRPQYKRFDSYFGQPFIWCILHNFGGVLNMYGPTPILYNEVSEARSYPNSSMIGTGIAPEGIFQNYVIYDYMSEMSWRTEKPNLTEWFIDYATRRYGKENENASKAWLIFKDTVYYYNDTGTNQKGKFAITIPPSLIWTVNDFYEKDKFAEGWKHLLDASEELGNNTGYLYDLVDTTRQVLQGIGDTIYVNLTKAFKNKNLMEFLENKILFSELFLDLEKILATNENFMLGKWLEDAKSVGENVDEKQNYEFNARNLITTWGPNGELKDYGIKQWAGLVTHYLAPRWELFNSEIYKLLITNHPINQTVISQKIYQEIEQPFSFQTNLFPNTSIGNSVEVAKEIREKWKKFLTAKSVKPNPNGIFSAFLTSINSL